MNKTSVVSEEVWARDIRRQTPGSRRYKVSRGINGKPEAMAPERQRLPMGLVDGRRLANGTKTRNVRGSPQHPVTSKEGTPKDAFKRAEEPFSH